VIAGCSSLAQKSKHLRVGTASVQNGTMIEVRSGAPLGLCQFAHVGNFLFSETRLI
jgi:hypothetical protein